MCGHCCTLTDGGRGCAVRLEESAAGTVAYLDLPLFSPTEVTY